MRKTSSPLAALLLAFASLLLAANYAVAEEEEPQERWFQIEILAFKNPTTKVDNPEVWPAFSQIEHPEDYIELRNSNRNLSLSEPLSSTRIDEFINDGSLSSFRALSSEHYQLRGERNRLDAQDGYQVLFHDVWNQPVPNREEVIPIRLEGGEQYGRQYEFQGYINLYVERYLHLAADLHLTEFKISEDPFSVIETPELTLPSLQPPTTEDDFTSLLNDNSPFINIDLEGSDEFYVSVADIELKENRRMRSREIHYFDNPKFGVLVYITPIETLTE